MATLVLVLKLCGLPRGALAAPTQAPTQNFTALRTDIAPPWVPDPDNRGTWSLLYSCVFTLVLCVWTAIHLNVPSYHESQISQWLRKVKWVLLAIIAPELGVYTACEQYFKAKNLIRQLVEISLEKETKNSYTTGQSETQLTHNSQSDPEKAASKRRAFSLIYGYFAVMGGLAVDFSDIDDRLHSMTLTPSGLELLAERGHFIEVSDDDIRDKSKADIFAKCLVILQVSWIALQTISRKATGYPLSPLEVHTLVHAACASVMYILWFRKPLDVQAPTIVSTAGFEDLIALMLMQTPRLGRTWWAPMNLMLMQTRRLGRTWYSRLDPPKDFEPAFKGPRSEASFLMFDGSALSRRDEGCSSCGRHPNPSTTTNVEVGDKGVLHAIPKAIPKTCDSCVNLSNSERHQARISEARTLSSQIIPDPPSGIRCGLPPGVKAVSELRSGDFTPDGIGLQPLMTMASYHDGYVPLPWWCCFLRFLNPRPPKPALPAQISPALKERLPEVFPEPVYWHEIHLSLSEKDVKRWELAGAAFLKELEILGISDPGNGRYRNFEIYQLLYEGSDIEGSDIEGSDIEGSDIEDGDIEGSDIEGGDIEEGDIEDGDIEGSDIEGGDIESWCFGPLLVRRCPNVTWGNTNDDSVKLLLVHCLLCSFYGGIHLALWSYDFPSRVESLLWRISGVTLVLVQALVVPVPLFYIAKKKYKNYSRRRRQAELPPPLPTSIDWLQKFFAKFCSGVRSKKEFWWKYLFRYGLICLGGPVALMYIFARVFIVVESFISLRHVPIGVYEGGLGWSRYIPHL